MEDSGDEMHRKTCPIGMGGRKISPVLSPVDEARQFATRIEALDRQLRKGSSTVPTREAKQEAANAMWALADALGAYEQGASVSELAAARRACREISSPWLLRSRLFARAYLKPHGFPGDFRLIEWIYDLERDAFEDATQPAIVNCLDYAFSTLHSVRAMWDRRRWFARLLAREHESALGELRVLDVACGSARSVADFLTALPSPGDVTITAADRDPAALAYCRTSSLAPWADRLRTVCVPIKALGVSLEGAQFEVIIAGSLFDSVDDTSATALLGKLRALLAPGGILALSNLHPSDPSRTLREWLVDWSMNLRDKPRLAALLPGQAETSRSPDGVLTYGWWRAA